MLEHAIQRFVVPPIISAVLVGIALLFFIDPALSIPAWLTGPAAKSPPLVSVVVTLLAASTGIFAIGFFNANVLMFFVRVFAFALRKPRGFSTAWSDEAERTLEKMYDFKDFRMEAEQCEQCFVGEVASSHVLSWMRRRWEYFAISANCAFACIMTAVLTPLFLRRFDCSVQFWWYVIVCIPALIFAFNGYQARREVMDMDNFLVRNIDNLYRLRSAMESPDIEGHVDGDAA